MSSRDLDKIWLLCIPTKVRWTAPADPHGSGSALRWHVIRECSDPHCRAIGSSLGTAHVGSVPAVNLPFGRGPKLRSRAIELEGGSGARRGAISAHERPRVPRSSAGLAGSRIRVYGMRIARPAELSPRPWISAATGRLHRELTTDTTHKELTSHTSY